MRILYDDAGDGGGQASDTSDTGDSGGSQAANWRQGLPEDIRENAALIKYENLEQAGRAFIGAQALMGKSPDQIMDRPKPGDMDARRTAISTLGGLPALEDGKVGDFKLAAHPVDNVPEWLGAEQPLGVGFLSQAHKLGLMPDQAQSVYGWFVETMMETSKQEEAKDAVSAETNARELEAKWGTGKFDQNLAAANFAIDKLGGEELRAAIDGANLGTNPLLLDAFQKVGFMLAEDTSGAGGGEPNFGTGDVSGGLRTEANAFVAISIDQKKTSTERREAADAAQVKFAEADRLDVARRKRG